MSWRIGMVAVFALAGSVLPLATPVSSVPKPPFSMVNLRSVQEQIQLEQEARLITVKILSSPREKRDRSLGSGVLFYQDKLTSTYGVITNNHVLQAGEAPYSIQTPDGKIHRANSVVRKKQLRGNGLDLALLEFVADSEYRIATKSNQQAAIGAWVMSAGFPLKNSQSKSGRFVIKPGKIQLVLDKALEGGYRIGSTNDVEKGMSGGPLLNGAGELVGINGLHANPIWGDPYVFEDGSYPTDAQREQISQYSWCIPLETVKQLLIAKGNF
ncbi:MAG: trypsin-like peptidase domain-containing protein [Dolichospermum sp. LBC05a]|nr:trypsin-like peptidase domain-containing protein [Dolichospermum sp. OL01]MCO5799206.1 trypsin-like peptidase domain-containing protein [Dolichospermum sp. OL03]MCS6280329.1 trypsin-like peptidase domain-containing protein [Dolichospermum sp.]QSV60578.1 MAG: trypsin-like peptidase domain-containing protein [Dolichospermum sp. LBC05a]